MPIWDTSFSTRSKKLVPKNITTFCSTLTTLNSTKFLRLFLKWKSTNNFEYCLTLKSLQWEWNTE